MIQRSCTFRWLAQHGPITSSAGVLTAVVFVSLAHGLEVPVGIAQVIAITMGVTIRLVAEWKGVEMQRRPPGGPRPSI